MKAKAPERLRGLRQIAASAEPDRQSHVDSRLSSSKLRSHHTGARSHVALPRAVGRPADGGRCFRSSMTDKNSISMLVLPSSAMMVASAGGAADGQLQPSASRRPRLAPTARGCDRWPPGGLGRTIARPRSRWRADRSGWTSSASYAERRRASSASISLAKRASALTRLVLIKSSGSRMSIGRSRVRSSR